MQVNPLCSIFHLHVGHLADAFIQSDLQYVNTQIRDHNHVSYYYHMDI